MAKFWHQISGRDLERAFVAQEKMSESVPAADAVYAWRRSFRAPPGVENDPAALQDWIVDAVVKPCSILPAKELSHFLVLHGLSIGGAALTDEKIETLRTWVVDAQARKWLIGAIETLASLTPPLYVGETENLAVRVRDHIGYKTGFSETLRFKLKLEWDQCDLVYCVIPKALISSNAKARRTFVELLIARLAVAGATSRPG